MAIYPHLLHRVWGGVGDGQKRDRQTDGHTCSFINIDCFVLTLIPKTHAVQSLSAPLLTMLVANLMLGVAVEAQFRQVITVAAFLQYIRAMHQLCYN